MSRASGCHSIAPDTAPPTLSTSRFLRNAAQYRNFDRLAPKACILAAFLLPLKLAPSYAVLVPLIIGYVISCRKDLLRFIYNSSVTSVSVPLAFLLLLAFLSGATGLSLTHSLPSLLSLAFFCITIPVFATYSRGNAVCSALITGQSIAALHSLFEAALPGGLSRLFLGKVTESGQLALTIPLAFGMCVATYQAKHVAGQTSVRSITPAMFSACTLTISLILLGFHKEAQIPPGATTALMAVVVLCCLYTICLCKKYVDHSWRSLILISTLQIPLLLCALVVNLKRGPWIGTLLALGVLCFVYARRFILVVIASAIVLASVIGPVRERLLDSYEHFTISGGRSTIWRIGAELVTEYPLGIGYHNSGIMREFAPEIPQELKHFHNNIINITTEMGWLGGTVFLWFLVAVIRTCFRDRTSALFTSIGCALISWQIAGLVEYNFGDSEITIVVWILLGLVLQRELGRSLPARAHHN